jgi:hypothetical protein
MSLHADRPTAAHLTFLLIATLMPLGAMTCAAHKPRFHHRLGASMVFSKGGIIPKMQLRGGTEAEGNEGIMMLPKDQVGNLLVRNGEEIEIINEAPHAQERYRQSRDDIGEAITRDGGVIKRILKAGTGKKRASQGDMVYIHYRGFVVSDGREFDDSRRTEQRKGRPFGFTLGNGEVPHACWLSTNHVQCFMDTYHTQCIKQLVYAAHT